MVRSAHCVSQPSISFLYISCVHKGIADATECATPSQINTRGSLFEISGKKSRNQGLARCPLQAPAPDRKVFERTPFPGKISQQHFYLASKIIVESVAMSS